METVKLDKFQPLIIEHHEDTDLEKIHLSIGFIISTTHDSVTLACEINGQGDPYYIQEIKESNFINVTVL